MDARRIAPAAARNAEPILAVLRGALPARGLLLEVASGSGEHALRIARAFPALTVQPSDPDPAARASIEAWRAAEGPDNLRAPLALDAASDAWPVEAADALLCINMIHISPWAATEGLMRGAARLLAPGAPLYLYGPYLEQGAETAPGNLAFDQSLRARDSAWGLRSKEAVVALAADHGLRFERRVAMPANNLSLVFRRA